MSGQFVRKKKTKKKKKKKKKKNAWESIQQSRKQHT